MQLTYILILACIIELITIYVLAQKKGTFKGFYSIFKDGNDWNEKTIIGFMSFGVMVIFALADLITGYVGKDLVISDNIYNSFLIITMGCFGIDGLQRVFKKDGNNEERPDLG